ncbi:MAG TPA: hypothetical protein P5186_25670 [Candidatus Paceibacterota bacterium]|nr:hypothetical protein [Verrucomicrobiota bacterium]HRY51449.1 hypothetical protein [Candidatus Paceibacterota bacterium]HRZ99495.1 hypothetical protein [Candidatus Paceibacterota bacterium]
MRHPTPDYPLLAIREALQSLVGASLAVFTVCVLGSMVPLAASWHHLPKIDDWFVISFAWVGHWVIAGLAFWGLFLAVVPAWCFYELIRGCQSPFRVLLVILLVQLGVSTVAVCSFAEPAERGRPLIASGIILLLTLIDGYCGFTWSRRHNVLQAHDPRARHG